MSSRRWQHSWPFEHVRHSWVMYSPILRRFAQPLANNKPFTLPSNQNSRIMWLKGRRLPKQWGWVRTVWFKITRSSCVWRKPLGGASTYVAYVKAQLYLDASRGNFSLVSILLQADVKIRCPAPSGPLDRTYLTLPYPSNHDERSRKQHRPVRTETFAQLMEKY